MLTLAILVLAGCLLAVGAWIALRKMLKW